MITVGAADWETPETIQLYGSPGPTPEGRTQPDLVDADCGQAASASYFCGTSRSSSHVAGMVALVRQRFPDLIPQQVVEYLVNSTQGGCVPGADNIWGSGFVVLPSMRLETPRDRDAPVALHNATDDPNWANSENWLSDRPIRGCPERASYEYGTLWYPCPDSNRGTRFRKPLLYPPELQGHLGVMPAEPCPRVQPRAVPSVTIVA